MKTVLQHIQEATNSDEMANRIYHPTETLLTTVDVVENDRYLGDHINSSLGCRTESEDQEVWPPIQRPDDYVVIYPEGQFSEPVTDETTSETVRVKDLRLNAVLHEILGPDPKD